LKTCAPVGNRRSLDAPNYPISSLRCAMLGLRLAAMRGGQFPYSIKNYLDDVVTAYFRIVVETA
jgi:hypothetical protein